MIGDREIAHAHRLGRQRHLFDAVPAIGVDRVTVRHAANILEHQRLRQSAARGGFDFAFVFAEFRRNILKPQALINLLFAAEMRLLGAVRPGIGEQSHPLRARDTLQVWR